MNNKTKRSNDLFALEEQIYYMCVKFSVTDYMTLLLNLLKSFHQTLNVAYK